jgi:hypothetical protein
MLALEGVMNADQIVRYIIHHDEKTALLGQIERMTRRIDEAVERWHSDRRAL